MSFIEKNGLKISSILFDFINKEVIPGTDIQTDKFWIGFEKTVHELAPINKKLIEKRETVQKEIDLKKSVYSFLFNSLPLFFLCQSSICF